MAERVIGLATMALAALAIGRVTMALAAPDLSESIRKFGSVYVNGQRIAYPDDAMIEIDGARVEASDMRIGQVARLVAARRGDGWTTSRIVIVSEVVGPVERVSGKRVEVLGQRVQLPNRKIARRFAR